MESDWHHCKLTCLRWLFVFVNRCADNSVRFCVQIPFEHSFAFWIQQARNQGMTGTSMEKSKCTQGNPFSSKFGQGKTFFGQEKTFDNAVVHKAWQPDQSLNQPTVWSMLLWSIDWSSWMPTHHHNSGCRKCWIQQTTLQRNNHQMHLTHSHLAWTILLFDSICY